MPIQLWLYNNCALHNDSPKSACVHVQYEIILCASVIIKIAHATIISVVIVCMCGCAIAMIILLPHGPLNVHHAAIDI